jgi:hypothetical protein
MLVGGRAEGERIDFYRKMIKFGLERCVSVPIFA